MLLAAGTAVRVVTCCLMLPSSLNPLLSSTSRVLTSLLQQSKLEPPVFDNSSSVSPEEWLGAVVSYKRNVGLSDAQVLSELSRFLRGEPGRWFQVLKPHLLNWAQFWELFQKAFLPFDNQEIIWRNILDHFQAPDEPLPTFIAHMLCEFAKLRNPPPDNEQVEIVCKHALEKYTVALYGTPVLSVADLLLRAHELHAALGHRDRIGPTPPLRKPATSVFCYGCSLPGFTAHNCPQCNSFDPGEEKSGSCAATQRTGDEATTQNRGPWGMPHADRVTLDTEASLSAIQATYAEKDSRGEIKCTPWPAPPLRLADSAPCDPIGVTWLPIRFQGQRFFHRFVILGQMSSPVILGMDFMLRASITIHVPSRTVSNGTQADRDGGAQGAAPILEETLCSLEGQDLSCLQKEAGSISGKVGESSLSHNQKAELQALLVDFHSLFTGRLGHTSLAEHRIETGDAKPINLPLYCTSPLKKYLIEEQIQKMLEEDIIEPASGPWAAPVVIVLKASGEPRFCVNYRGLNHVTVKDRYPLPRVDESLDLARGKLISTIDLARGYWQQAEPLFAVTRQDSLFLWDESCQQAMDFLKERLTSAPIICFPDFERTFDLHIDACDVGLGAALTQRDKAGQEVVVAYASRTLHKSEKPYSTTEKECLGVIWALEHFRLYIEVTVYTDHSSLKWLMSRPNPTGRLARWCLRLQDFDIRIIHKPGAQNQVPDALSQNPLQSDQGPTDLLPEHAVIAGLDLRAQPVVELTNKEHLQRLQHDDPALAAILQKLESSQCTELEGDWETKFVIHEGLLYYKESSPSQKKPADLLVPVHASEPWEVAGVDFVGPLPRKAAGNAYILVFVDYFSKWVEVSAVREATAQVAANKFQSEVFTRHGAPKYLISDRGTPFMSELFNRVVRILGSEHRLTTAYHPQTNATKRVNRTLKTAIRAYVEGKHNSPPQSLERSLEETYDHARATLKFSHKRQKHYYDWKRRPVTYQLGDLVRLKTHPRSDAVANLTAKLACVYAGPYRVVQKLSEVNYRLANMDGTDVGVVHVVNLQPFYTWTTAESKNSRQHNSSCLRQQVSHSADKEGPVGAPELLEEGDDVEEEDCAPDEAMGVENGTEGEGGSSVPSIVGWSQNLAEMLEGDNDVPIPSHYDLRNRADTTTVLELDIDYRADCDPDVGVTDSPMHVRVLDMARCLPTMLSNRDAFGTVVIHVGTNNICARQSEVLKELYQPLLDTAKKTTNARIVISGPLPTYRKGCEWFSRLFGLQSWLRGWCAVNGLGFVDNWSSFWEQPEVLYRWNGLHPSRLGSRILSRNIERAAH
ncbi:hypothetical protein NFI96_006573 [Prochilodus magdalenae]|nr:hypothetical protein NFI96_006573 [Prochilodus magdalenae]